MRPSNVMVKALSAAFGRFVQRFLPRPVGSRGRATRWRYFKVACPVGKWPRARVARRILALSDSTALVSGMKWVAPLARVPVRDLGSGIVRVRGVVEEQLGQADLYVEL